MSRPLRHLVVVLGDQLNADASAFDGFDPAQDAIWLAEVAEESEHVWSSQPRIAVFLASMRHFRDARRAEGKTVHYTELDDPKNAGTLAGELARAVKKFKPSRLIMTEPGEWRVWQALEAAAGELGLPLEVRVDRHFYASIADFKQHALGRKQFRLEFFYRELRRKNLVLLDAKGEPEGGQWNYDHDNRGSFPKGGPKDVPAPVTFAPDTTTREVLALVAKRFAKHPGKLAAFDWPVTPAEAQRALDDFIAHRLMEFGQFQDAMWTKQPWLYHSRLSAALNLKLLDPRTVVAAAERAYREGKGRVSLASAEGFIRQILGWREYVRGIYWHFMPDYAEKNALKATEALPAFYWTGDTEMACLRDSIGQALDYGYSHHIQRLMVLGNYFLLGGYDPKAVLRWYTEMYIDAYDWVMVPNVLGMILFSDGGFFATKPYAAGAAYQDKMGNHCSSCRFDPKKKEGPDACPFHSLYWNFFGQHAKLFGKNPRIGMMVKIWEKKSSAEQMEIRQNALRFLDQQK
jgi:deoxyribodipyrimidine photolyase-related protein